MRIQSLLATGLVVAVCALGSGAALASEAPVAAKADEKPTVAWLTEFDGPDRKDDKLFGVVEVKEGGYISVGTTEHVDNSVDALILAHDASGAQVWERRVPMAQFNAVIQTSQGFLAVGNTSQDPAAFAALASGGTPAAKVADGDPDYDAAAVLFDADGTLIWCVSIGGSGYDTFTGHSWARTGYPVALENGNFLIPGSSSSSDGPFEGMNQGGADAFLMELDPQGALVSLTTYGGTGYDSMFDVKALSAGGFIAAGVTHPAVDENDVHQPVDGTFAGLSQDWEEGNLFVSRLDADRQTLWTAMLHTYGTSWGVGVAEMPDGGILVAGDTFQEYVEGQNRDLFVHKLDADGNLLWQKPFGDEGSVFVTSLEPSADGNVILTGECHYASVIDEGAEGIRGWMGSIDTDGNLLWSRHYDGTDYEVLFHVSPTADGGYIAVGEQASEKGDWNGSLIKYEAHP